MKPVLVHWKDQPEGDAHLVDADCTAVWSEKDGTKIFPRCIAIGDLRAGDFAVVTDPVKVFPSARCLVYAPDRIEIKNPMFRGIYPDAALALLGIPLVDVVHEIARNKFRIGGLSGGYDSWRFKAAWFWSYWQQRHLSGDRWTLKRRWEDLKWWGYPYSEGAFRRMMSDLSLSVTNSGPNP